MRISQLAERTGIPATTLRFYETAGLLPAERTQAGYRNYGEGAVDRLAFIGAAKQLGLPLEEIAELLRVWESGACREVKGDLRPRIAARISDAEQRTTELATFTISLRRALAHLDALPGRSGPCDPRCGFLAAREDSEPDFPWQAEADTEGQSAPVACSLTGEDIAERAGQWRQLLSGAEHEAIGNSVRLVVPAERTGQIVTLAAAEQQCCPFFDFRLHLDGPVLRLEVRAPAEGAALLAELFTPAT